MNRKILKAMLLAAASVLPLAQAQAHTSSVGYENAGPGAVTFWYGTYHPGTSFTEGSMSLVGQDVTYSSTSTFTLLTSTRPAGLDDGTTNFYSDGAALTGTDTSGGIMAWQGVSFSGLQAGTYVFTYVPIAHPTSTWQPIDSVILSSQVTLSSAVVGGGDPGPSEPQIIDASQGSFSQTDAAASGQHITFGGGTLAPTQAASFSQGVTLDGPGGTVDTSGGDVAFSGVIDGAGGLTKQGPGVLRLTGANSYSGGTQVLQGVLAGDATSLAGPIVNNAEVRFEQSSDGVFSGSISGAGGLVKAGAGTLTLDGVNSYTGPTTIAEGALALQLNQASSAILSGAIGGAGQLVKTGAGQLTLSSANSFSGGVTLNAGTLTLNNIQALGAGPLSVNQAVLQVVTGGVLANPISLQPGGTLTLNNSQPMVLAGPLTGTGGLVKSGGGLLNFTGDGSLSGPVLVEEGRLAVNGSLKLSTLTVGSGGQVGGNGTLGGLIVKRLATAAPGNSIGQLTVGSFVVFEKGSFYAVEVDAAGHADRIEVTGQATLEGGTVQVLAEAGAYQPLTTYRILSAGTGVAGRFDAVTSNLAFLSPELSYGSNTVDLTLVRNDVAFAAVAQTRNQAQVGAASDQAFRYGSPVYDALVRGTAGEARAAFDAMSGEAHAQAGAAAVAQAGVAREIVASHLSGAAEAGRSAWGEALGAWGRTDGDGNAAKATRRTGGLMLGGELHGEQGFVLGLAGGYSETDVDVDDRASEAKIKAAHLWAYGAADAGALRLRGGLGYQDLRVETQRSATLRGLRDPLHAAYDGSVVQGFVEAGWRTEAGGVALEPFIGLDALRLSTDAFRETGGALALDGRGGDLDVSMASFGVRAEGGLGSDALRFRVSAAARQSLQDATPAAELDFRAAARSFRVEAAPLDELSLAARAELTWQAGPRLTVTGGYAGQVGERAQDHAVSARIRYAF